jgi:hypothetical protein
MAGFKKITLPLAVALIAASATFVPGKARPERPPLETLLDGHKVVNVVDDFLAFWEQARSRSPRAQRKLWEQTVESRHRHYFDRAVYRGAGAAERRAMLDEFLARVPDHINEIRELNARINNGLMEALVYMRSRFPEYRHRQDVYVGLSLFRFDGAVRPVHNEAGVPDTLCLGADVLAGYTAQQLQMTIAHEFFHLYHFGYLFRHTSVEELRTPHMPLVIEGLAVAGAEAIYPSLMPEMYLHFSEKEHAAQREQLATISQRYLALIRDGATPADYEPWFTNTESGEAPPRAGYLLGYEVATRMRGALTLEQVVKMTPAELREHAEEQLTAMALDRVMLMADPQ